MQFIYCFVLFRRQTIEVTNSVAGKKLIAYLVKAKVLFDCI